jgi:hypothetical protein
MEQEEDLSRSLARSLACARSLTESESHSQWHADWLAFRLVGHPAEGRGRRTFRLVGHPEGRGRRCGGAANGCVAAAEPWRAMQIAVDLEV